MSGRLRNGRPPVEQVDNIIPQHFDGPSRGVCALSPARTWLPSLDSGSDGQAPSPISVRAVEIPVSADQQAAGNRLVRARPRDDTSSSPRSWAGPGAEHRLDA